MQRGPPFGGDQHGLRSYTAWRWPCLTTGVSTIPDRVTLAMWHTSLLSSLAATPSIPFLQTPLLLHHLQAVQHTPDSGTSGPYAMTVSKLRITEPADTSGAG